MDKTQYQITGMTCQACATRLEKVLNKRPDVALAQVNFATETLQVEWAAGASQDDTVRFDEITNAMSRLGFGVLPMGLTANDSPIADIQSVFGVFIEKNWLLLLLALPFMLGMAGMLFGVHGLMPPVWLQFILASVVQFWVARHFYVQAWASIRTQFANMDVLVVLGTLATWLYSTWAFVQGLLGGQAGHVYFEASVMIITFMHIGKFLENQAKKESLDSVRSLLALIPDYIHFKDQYGIRKIATKKAQVGQIAFVKSDDRIALDGVMVSGEIYCDESHLTGESRPLAKRAGDKVISGAMVVSGVGEYRIRADYQSSYLKRLIDDLALAQGSKASLASIADNVVGVFVPVVVAIACLTFLLNLWFLGSFETSLMRAVAVLVVACPCALGLATPTAIMAGMGLAAAHGVWFKDAKNLELVGKIDTVVFDKTGTLTQGRLNLVGRSVLDGKRDFDEILSLSASLEQYANHPIAQALVDYAAKQQLPIFHVEDSQVVAGSGVQGVVLVERDGNTQAVNVKVGKPEFVDYPIANIPTQGVWAIASLVAVAIDGEAVAVFAFADDIKTDAQAVIDALHSEDIRPMMMSGDKSSAVTYVARRLGIEQFAANLSPQDKAVAIATLQLTGAKVAMIGDGVNDVLAVTQADASFAVANATDAAKHSSTAILQGDSLFGVYYAHRIAKRTVATIYQNLFFAFIYNVIGIPLAALGLLNPMLAAAMMAGSSLSVIINALRLKKLKLKLPKVTQSP